MEDEPIPVEVETPLSDGDVAPNEAPALHTTVTAMVAAFAECEAVTRAAFKMIVRAEKNVNDVFSLGGSKAITISAGASESDSSYFNEPERAIERMRRHAWSSIIDKLEIRRVMSDAAWTALNEELNLDGRKWKAPPPQPITIENVMRFAEKYAGNPQKLFNEKVAECFAWIRPFRSALKTNIKNATFEIGPKVILGSIVDGGSFVGGKFSTCYAAKNHLQALESVFLALDGKGFRSTTHYGELCDAIDASKTGTGETAYFRFRAFMNGNLHLEFKRLDLLHRLNMLAGGANLKPSNGSVGTSRAIVPQS